MRIPRPNCLIALLCGLLIAASSIAQEADESAAPALPDVASLEQDWWSYFVAAPDEIEPRIEAFLEQVNAQISGLGAQNQELAPAIVDAVRDNLEVYLSLSEEVDAEPQTLPEPDPTYSIDELLGIAATARAARADARAAETEVERERRILDGASERRDALFKAYLDAAEGDERWLAGLRLVRARSAQAIAARRLEILTQSAELATAYANAVADRVDIVLSRLGTDGNEQALDALDDIVNERQAEVDAAIEREREAQVAASGIGADTAQGRSEQRVAQQRALDAEVELGLARIMLSAAQARRYWTALELRADVDLSDVEDASIQWSELIRSIETELPDWKRQTGDELLAVQGIDRDGLDRATRRVLDQRVGTAQETLGHIGDLESAIADLELLMIAVDDAIAETSGTLRQWLSNAYRTVKTALIRLTEVSDTTLFSVAETPVTVGDLVQGFVILIIGWLLSRGIRFAINRVGRDESVGTQASLYTLGRLTHYTIIIVAALIALTSVGLSFTNVAIVAGALSVGIGFGLQSIVNNFVSGLIILFERTLRVGDYIELDTGLTGTVKAINVRSTLINTNDNIDIVVPNSEFVSTKLTNWTLGEHILRVRIPFGVAYGSDKEVVRKAAIEACEKVPYTLTHMRGREPDVWLVEYGDNSLNFLLLVWVNRQGARRPTRTRAAYLWALEDKLAEYGIEIPFPQRDLHLRSGWPDREVPPC
ncbi:MAG: mechanosensitive ion channel [Woeseiaceae bacterium]|nr:mechanosensitive ion channel [Woeseiaceae bacterium]